MGHFSGANSKKLSLYRVKWKGLPGKEKWKEMKEEWKKKWKDLEVIKENGPLHFHRLSPELVSYNYEKKI